MFLSGGGLNQLADTAQPAGQQPAAWTMPSGAAWPATPTPSTTAAAAPAAPPAYPTPTAPPLAPGPTITIASFNIQDFGQAKSGREHIMLTLAAIVRRFDLVAVQEISSQDPQFVANFVNLINQPPRAGQPGRRYDFIVGPRVGNGTAKEQFAYIFNTDTILCDRSSAFTVGDPNNLLSREPFVASFATRAPPDVAFTFTLINVHTDPEPASVLRVELDALAEVYRVVRRTPRNEDDVIMLGDFNADDRHLGRLGQIPGIWPLIRNVFTNTRQNKLYDNIIMHQLSTTEFVNSGVFDVMRDLGVNMSQTDALEVSDHFPVWAAFSVYEKDAYGNVASRRGMVR
jgi:endonuclease/exonuclease/phosphatase family metal-dependent hydrolase